MIPINVKHIKYTLILFFFVSCMGEPDKKYFLSPKSAVDKIKILQSQKNWKELATYYDLNNSIYKLDALESGRFFYSEMPPTDGRPQHPARLWKYLHPFHPSYNYSSSHDLKHDIVAVNMMISIDQGVGTHQMGHSQFYLIKSSKGYQVLPLPKNSMLNKTSVNRQMGL